MDSLSYDPESRLGFRNCDEQHLEPPLTELENDLLMFCSDTYNLPVDDKCLLKSFDATRRTLMKRAEKEAANCNPQVLDAFYADSTAFWNLVKDLLACRC